MLRRELFSLMVISIIVGSLLAGVVSLSANAYFSRTLASLVGDYGQYDLVIQAREEVKDDTAVQIQKVLNDVFPGATMKEGPTITGKTNFFVALPDKYKTKEIYENLNKSFGSLPGGAGVGTMTEPRLTIRGVPEGAKNMVIDAISGLDGVRFVFHDGASLGVILTSLDKSAAVSGGIKDLLNRYQVIEVSFPVGSEPANPLRLGDTVSASIRAAMPNVDARNVSVDGKNDDMAYMVSTMLELKKFLVAYASQVSIAPGSGKALKDDVIAFQGTEPAPPVLGQPAAAGNVLVQISGILSDGTAQGLVIHGDTTKLVNAQGYKIENNAIGAATGGPAQYRSPRQELGNALTQTNALVGQIPGFAQDAQNMSNIAMGALDRYGGSVEAVAQTLTAVGQAGTMVQTATAGLANIDTSALQGQLDHSSQALGGVMNTLQVLRLVNNDLGPAIDNLAATRQNLSSLNSGLASLSHVAADARGAKTAIDNIVSNGNTTVAALRSFDTVGARAQLTDINARLKNLQTINTPLIGVQLQYMAVAVPALQDEEISKTVGLLDKFIAGQVIPGARLQILTSSGVSADSLAPIIYREAGHQNLSIYTTAAGVIEPNARGELYQVLKEVKAILAGMTAIGITLLFLALDHTAIMSALGRKRQLTRAVSPGSWRRKPLRILQAIFAVECRYGMAVGATLLTAMFALAQGGIPYLPWLAVPPLGALLGLIVARNAEKISPVSSDEITAGEALGLSFDEIIQEIVLPAGRPGLMQKLNHTYLKFK